MNLIVIDTFCDIFIASSKFAHLKETSIHFRDLITYPILMLEKETTTRIYIQDLFKKYALQLEPEIESGSIDLLVDLAKIGLGISFVPDYCLLRNNENMLFRVNTQEIIPKRHLGIAINENMPLSQASKKFIELF